jgi:hypothetical protein
MSRTGKIARLPRPLREEVNRRLQNGTPGRAVVAWLNERPNVKEVMAQHFGGNPVNEQNLSEWKQGGYAEWMARQDLVEQVREAAGDAAELAKVGGPLADHAAQMLAARYGLALAEWDGDPDHPAAAKLRALGTHSRELIALRRGDHSAARLRMEQVRFDDQQAAAAEGDRLESNREFAAEFHKFLQRPDIRRLLENDTTTAEERIHAITRMVWGDVVDYLDNMTPDERLITIANRAINGDGI